MTSQYQLVDPSTSAENEQLRFALQAAGVGTWDLDPVNHQVRLDNRCKELYGFAPEDDVTYSEALQYNHPDDRALVEEAIRRALDPHCATPYDIIHRVTGANDGKLRWLRCQGKAYFNEEGVAYRFSGVTQDITHDIRTRRQLEASEVRFQSLIQEAPVATCLFMGRELRIELANAVMLGYWGKDKSVIGKRLEDAVPELKGQPFLQILDEVFTTGKPYEAKAAAAILEVNGVLGTYYFDFTYKPLRNAAGEIYAIMEMAIDVTEEVKARQKLEESELYSRSIIHNSPVPKMIFCGPDMVINTVNEKMLEMLGLQPSIIGKPLAEALPELMQTSLMDLLQTVFTTGQTYHGPEAKLEIHRNGQLHIGYYNVSYKALWNTAGEIYGIINTAIEVTEQVLARKKLEEAEESLRGAIELAQLATWTVYPESGMVTYSDRLKEWGSATEDRHLFEDGFNSIPESDRERIRRATEWAMDPRSGGFYNEEHPIINPRTGQRRVIHAQTRTYFDPAGKAVKVVGTAQDITQQRELQLALEQQVQKRTEELGRSNEELAAINKELAESNQLLIHSNQNLQQFAYVASHDLQEPLRKIQSFGDILKNRYADQLGDGVTYLERMRMAASRMSVLIRDLLIFSRMSTRQEATDSVDLNGVVKTALNDLDLLIQETGAVVEVPSLPTIQGNQSQLGQLFQNLISNALKFRRADGTPAIRIGCQVIDHIDLPAQVKPTKLTGAYYAISVSDNGIGFDNRYVDRIFQVFQRLHTKTEYVGTGIGLAICEKVATNHGGAITAISQPGEGSTFCLYLPVSSDNLPPTVIRFS